MSNSLCPYVNPILSSVMYQRHLEGILLHLAQMSTWTWMNELIRDNKTKRQSF